MEAVVSSTFQCRSRRWWHDWYSYQLIAQSWAAWCQADGSIKVPASDSFILDVPTDIHLTMLIILCKMHNRVVFDMCHFTVCGSVLRSSRVLGWIIIQPQEDGVLNSLFPSAYLELTKMELVVTFPPPAPRQLNGRKVSPFTILNGRQVSQHLGGINCKTCRLWAIVNISIGVSIQCNNYET